MCNGEPTSDYILVTFEFDLSIRELFQYFSLTWHPLCEQTLWEWIHISQTGSWG